MQEDIEFLRDKIKKISIFQNQFRKFFYEKWKKSQ